ncbi:hypothetical protein [Streptomyces sioyaensis]|uniref:hypothetical protein n=1 Tax=Streptomyces sioyaensis TaxID=67364 RepID=UPI003D71600D
MRIEVHRYFLGPAGGNEPQWAEVPREKFNRVWESCMNQLYNGRYRSRPGRNVIRIPYGMYFDDGGKRAGVRTVNGRTPWENGFNGRPDPQ